VVVGVPLALYRRAKAVHQVGHEQGDRHAPVKELGGYRERVLREDVPGRWGLGRGDGGGTTSRAELHLARRAELCTLLALASLSSLDVLAEGDGRKGIAGSVPDCEEQLAGGAQMPSVHQVCEEGADDMKENEN
jgi:hypothetical protein